MKIWYFHYYKKGIHPRNEFLWKEVGQSWREAGHKFKGPHNLAGSDILRQLTEQDARASVAYINNFHCAERMKADGFNFNRASFRLYMTGGGWRWSDWVKRSLRGIEDCKAHIVCLTHRVHEAQFKKIHKRVFHVGLGFDPATFYPAEERKEKGKIVFCGNPGMGRERRLNLLIKKFPGRVAWCNGLSYPDYAAFLRSGNIGWNQISEGPQQGVSCNLRVWELLGTRILLFSSRSKHVPLQDGVHYVAWDNDKDMLEKADYYLTHPEEREKIAGQGYEEAIRKHTWRHRALEYRRLVEQHL